MVRYLALLTAALLLGCPVRGGVSGTAAGIEMADLVLVNATFRTLDPEQPTAEGLAVRGGSIVHVGDRAGAEALAGDTTRVIDLHGATVLPGLIDAHAHFLGLGKTLRNLDLVGTGSAGDVRRRVLDACGDAAEGEWIYGRGWDQNDWDVKEFPTWRDLSGCGRPVYLSRVDGHALWVNDVALRMAKIHKGTPDPDGGRILRDERGIPTGVLVDNAEALILDLVPEASHSQRVEWAQLAQRECLRRGLTGVGDAGVDASGFAVYDELGRTEQLKIRIDAMVQQDEDLIEQYLALGPQLGLHDGHLTVRSIKLYADGALGSRGAALLAAYSDDPGNEGLLVTADADIEAITSRALTAGFQVCTHAIGDRANRVVLDAYERALSNHPEGEYRLRVEHAQIVHIDDIPRFAQLGVIPSMQPTHATSDMPWAADRLGTDRLAGAYAWQSLLDTRVRLPFGSDFPVEAVNPLWGIYAAVTRQDHAGLPAGGWLPEQRVTVEQAVRGFTSDAAYASFDEARRGTIEVGKLADLTVLSKDIFTIPPDEILQTHVLMTIIGGEVVYESGVE